ncbi:hypothetical protein IG631_07082 [Alternaria alternata]|nr:hypothetical protein IG631_07082 [Alternaria alternata]
MTGCWMQIGALPVVVWSGQMFRIEISGAHPRRCHHRGFPLCVQRREATANGTAACSLAPSETRHADVDVCGVASCGGWSSPLLHLTLLARLNYRRFTFVENPGVPLRRIVPAVVSRAKRLVEASD